MKRCRVFGLVSPDPVCVNRREPGIKPVVSDAEGHVADAGQELLLEPDAHVLHALAGGFWPAGTAAKAYEAGLTISGLSKRTAATPTPQSIEI